jgi:uncharacterized protein YdaL
MVPIRVTDSEQTFVAGTTTYEELGDRPWVIRSGHLTYLAEVPLSYTTPTDRSLALAAELADHLDPAGADDHRAVIRLEDVSPMTDPDDLSAVIDVLAERDTPFAVGVVPIHVEGATRTELADRPRLVEQLQRALDAGGELVLHGVTHELDGVPNPDGGTGADWEFFRVVRDEGELVFLGPVSGDSPEWLTDRLAHAYAALDRAGLPRPELFEFPHYAASATDYTTVSDEFDGRFERSFYHAGLLGAPATGARAEQAFPYPVEDVYGATVIPENLGYVTDPEAADGVPPELQVDLVLRRAEDLLVVPGSVAGFFYHPWLGPETLAQLVDGLTELGFDPVAPSALVDRR